MTSIVVLGFAFVGLVLAAVIVWHRRSSRACPACDVELLSVSLPGEGPNKGYEIAACVRCSHTATFVEGVRSELAPCPACHEPTLEVPTVRLAGLPPRVGVRECCTHCGHEKSFTVAARDEGPHGKVIEFPGAADRGRRRARHQHGAK